MKTNLIHHSSCLHFMVTMISMMMSFKLVTMIKMSVKIFWIVISNHLRIKLDLKRHLQWKILLMSIGLIENYLEIKIYNILMIRSQIIKMLLICKIIRSMSILMNKFNSNNFWKWIINRQVLTTINFFK